MYFIIKLVYTRLVVKTGKILKLILEMRIFCLIFYEGMLGLWELLLVFGGILVGSIQAVFSFYNNFRRVQLRLTLPNSTSFLLYSREV